MIKVPVEQYLKDLAAFSWTYFHHLVVGASTNPTLVKADPSLLCSVKITPINGLVGNVYVKFHNTSVAPVAGSTPVVKTVGVPAGGTGVPVFEEFSSPILFDKGLAYTVTKGILDDNASVCVASDCVVDLTYR